MLPSHFVMGSVIANEIQRVKQAGSSVDGHCFSGTHPAHSSLSSLLFL